MKISSYFDASKYYFEPKVAIVFFLGIASGLPFLLLLSTLTVWLIEVGFSKTSIGLMAWVTLPYTFKFLWAPFFDKYKLPLLGKIFGHKKSWLIFIQIFLAICIIGLGNSSPENGLTSTAIWAFAVGLLSSCQDILVEGYRIDSLKVNRAGYGAGASVVGYRIGMLIASAGALYLSNIMSWQGVYYVMAAILLIGMVAGLCAHEPEIYQNDLIDNKYKGKKLTELLAIPVSRIISRTDCSLIFVFILSFKASDTILNTMNMPFLMEIGFSKLEIAHVAKTFGIFAMMVGGAIGGILLSRCEFRNILIFCMTLQIISGLLFIFQGLIGNDIRILFFTMGIENFTSGMSQVSLIYYLTLLCQGSMSGLLFALMTSLASFDRVAISMVTGYLADNLSWSEFFFVSGICSLPAVWIVCRYKEHFLGVEHSKINEHLVFENQLLRQ